MVLVEECVKNEHKNNGPSNTVSNVDLTCNFDGDFTLNVNTHLDERSTDGKDDELTSSSSSKTKDSTAENVPNKKNID